MESNLSREEDYSDIPVLEIENRDHIDRVQVNAIIWIGKILLYLGLRYFKERKEK